MEVSKRAVKNMQKKKGRTKKRGYQYTPGCACLTAIVLFIIIRVYQGLVEIKEIKEKPEKE